MKLVGKYEIAPIVMFGINPGYSLKNNPTEDREARIFLGALSSTL